MPPRRPPGWYPGQVVSTNHEPGQSEGSQPPLMLVQRAPADDGWLAIDSQGVVFNIFDVIARRYSESLTMDRAPFKRALLGPLTFFGMEPVRLEMPRSCAWRDAA